MYDNDPAMDADRDERRNIFTADLMLGFVGGNNALRLNGRPLAEDFASNYLDNIVRLYEDCPTNG